MSSESPDPSPREGRSFSVKLDRLQRRATAYRHVWKGRVIFWSAAILTGLVAVFSANATGKAEPCAFPARRTESRGAAFQQSASSTIIAPMGV